MNAHTHTAYIAFGSNLGVRDKNIAAALNALEATKEVTVKKVSGLYETQPVGGPQDQAPYLNAAARVATTLPAIRLLALCQKIEDLLGRTREVQWGPRTIDLDLLLFDDEIHATAELTLPHPRMHERRFVLEPLAEIAPGLIHPMLGQTVQDLLAALKPDDQSR